jgi:small subunit ribosomal protein S2
MAIVTMRQMLDAGVHFGHQTRRWNPKMKRFILTERNGIYVIDLQQTVSYIDQAFSFVKNTVAKGGNILFVGTKKQAQESIEEQAQRVGMPFVNQRWLGGMLTNFQTVNKRLQRLKELEEMDLENASGSAYTKKELLMMRRERDKLARTLGGIRNMAKVPQAVWIVDTKKEHLAVDEARKLGVPVVAILDTNCDPDEVDYKIPGNDDAIRAVSLLTRVIADAVAEGLVARHAAAEKAAAAEGEEAEAAEAEPLPEWEAELLAVATEDAAAPEEADKAAEPKAKAAKAETPKAAAPKKAKPAPKAEAPKAEAPKAEEPKAEPAPEVEAPKAEEPKAEPEKSEAPEAEAAQDAKADKAE